MKVSVEVKNGESLKVDPGDDKIIHLSNACMGDVTKDIGGGPVALYVKFGNQKFVLGTLSSDKFPQISYDLVFEKEFELSHNWKYGNIDEDIPVSAVNGKPEVGVKPDANEAKQKKIADPRKRDANGEDDDSSESDSDDDSSEDKCPEAPCYVKVWVRVIVRSLTFTYAKRPFPDLNPWLTANGDIESSEGDDDSDDDEEEEGDDESDEETAKKIEASNKRGIESSKKTPVPVKKTKFVTPQKTDSKNVVHAATPHPSKQAGKATANNKLQSPKSGGDYSCKPCNRLFKTEDALSSHNKAKHSAK
ncbi:Histone deacetylase HDT3 [Glycine soja]|nr:Histone deacetylase HDT3 [Glycine soja]